MKVLLTGAGGQVGIELIAELRRRGHTVVGTDVASRPATVAEDVPWHALDVTDATRVQYVLGQENPELVVHLAAILSSGGEQNPQLCYAINMTGTYNVLEGCRRFQVKPRLVFTSTIAAFGPGLPDPVPNEVSMRPTTMYGVTKVAGELLGEYYFAKYGLDFRCVRYPGLISAGKPGAGTSDYALFMYVNGIRDGRYTAFCRPDTRIPFMYMPDAIRATVELATADRARLQRCTYNVAAMSPRADEIAASVVRGVAPQRVELTFEPVAWRQAILDSWPRALDDRRAREEWGWRPQYDLDAMTRAMVPKVREMVEKGLLPRE
jgi:nucleoside-diphosphate-sugar epimerase